MKIANCSRNHKLDAILFVLGTLCACDSGSEDSESTGTTTEMNGTTSDGDGDGGESTPGQSSSAGATTNDSGGQNDSSDSGVPGDDSGDSGSTSDGGDDGDESSDNGSGDDDTGAPVGGIGELVWLVDGETGSRKPSGSAHDGLESQICETQSDEALSFIDMPDAYGDKALRLVMKKNWPWGTSNACDVKMRTLLMDRDSVKIDQGETAWIGWAVYVPADWTMKNNGGVTSLNVHGIPGTPPQVRVNLGDSQWQFRPRDGIDIGDASWPLETAKWHEIVIEASFDKGDDGYFKLWHKLREDSEWTQHVDYEGRTAQGSAEFPFHIRYGMDIPSQNWGNGHSERILFYDEVRVGNEMSSFDEVAPGNNFVPPGS